MTHKHGIRRFSAVSCLLSGVFFVAGCDAWRDVRQALGMEKAAVDDSEIITLPPLAIPPDYAIRPPRDGSPSSPYPMEAETATMVPPAPAPGGSVPGAEYDPWGGIKTAPANGSVPTARQAPPPVASAPVPVLSPAGPDSATDVSAPSGSYSTPYGDVGAPAPTYDDPALAEFNRALNRYGTGNFR